MQMKYHPKEIYYVVKDGFASIVLDYGEHKTIHQIFAAQQSVQADEAAGCAHRAPRVIGENSMFCDDCGKTLRR